MTHIAVKPHPDLDPKAWNLLKHPVSGALLDAAGKIPAGGRPWLNDGFTARMLTDGAVIRADHPAFEGMGVEKKPEDKPKADEKPAAQVVDAPKQPEPPKPAPATPAAPPTAAAPAPAH